MLIFKSMAETSNEREMYDDDEVAETFLWSHDEQKSHFTFEDSRLDDLSMEF
jgi:hypothetical protein